MGEKEAKTEVLPHINVPNLKNGTLALLILQRLSRWDLSRHFETALFYVRSPGA
jgi:hypothetical protein